MFAPSDDWDAPLGSDQLIQSLFGTPAPFSAPLLNGSAQTTKQSKGSNRRKSGGNSNRPDVPAKKLASASGAESEKDISSIQRSLNQKKKRKKEKLRRNERIAKASLAASDGSNLKNDSLPADGRDAGHVKQQSDEHVDGTSPSGRQEDDGEDGATLKLKQNGKRTQESYLDKAEKRLRGSRFRILNEQLYTCTGSEAMKLFQDDPAAYEEYHEGYREQMNQWPEQPVQTIVKWLKKQPKSWIVADFGCGDALIAQSVPQTVHSFDLCAVNEQVTVCNMESVPLGNEAVNAAVFCLSLMGVNVVDFLVEARRVLKVGGFLEIVEVASRFENVKQFVHKVQRLGFELVSRTNGQKDYFTLFRFKKIHEQAAKGVLPEIKLKPCIYKRR